MARSEREAAQRKRAEARERRRKQPPDEQTDQVDSSPAGDGNSTDEPLAAVKQAAKVAAAGAAVGAAAAAARALGKHDEGAEEHQPERNDATPAEKPKTEEPEQREPEPERQPQQESRPEPRENRSEFQDERPPGASPDEARNVVRQARGQLEALLGREPESVSAMERTHDGWLVTVEVLEVSRIPESTDVLASYEIELDENTDLRRYARVRRYHRAQADQGGGA